MEVHLYPRRQVPDIPALTGEERDDFARAYLDVLQAMDGLYDTPLPVHRRVAPGAGADRPRARVPGLEVFSVRRAADKLKYLAGSESGMGVFVNDVTPEHIAAQLREAATA